MWKITPLDLGTLSVTLASQICRHGVAHDVGKVVKAPCIAWLLKNESTEELILVDAGPRRIRCGEANIIIPLSGQINSSWNIGCVNRGWNRRI